MDPEYVNAPSRRYDDDDDIYGAGGGARPPSKQALRWARAGVEGACDLLLDVVDTILGIEYEEEADLLPVSHGAWSGGSGGSGGGGLAGGGGSGSFSSVSSAGSSAADPDSPRVARSLSGLLAGIPGRGIRALKSLIPRPDEQQQQQQYQRRYDDLSPLSFGELDVLPCTRAQAKTMAEAPRVRPDALLDLAPYGYPY